jgi:hypothetical protein
MKHFTAGLWKIANNRHELKGVERGSGGPKGQESLAQGLPWGRVLR